MPAAKISTNGGGEAGVNNGNMNGFSSADKLRKDDQSDPESVEEQLQQHLSDEAVPSRLANGYDVTNHANMNQKSYRKNTSPLLLKEEQQHPKAEIDDVYNLYEHQPPMPSEHPPMLPHLSSMLLTVLTGYEEDYDYDFDNNYEEDDTLKSLLSSRFMWYLIHLARCHNPIYCLHGGAGPTAPTQDTQGHLMSLCLDHRSVFQRKAMLWLGLLAELVISSASLRYVLPYLANRTQTSTVATIARNNNDDAASALETIETKISFSSFPQCLVRRLFQVISSTWKSTAQAASQRGDGALAAAVAANGMLSVLQCLDPTLEVWARSKYYLFQHQKMSRRQAKLGRDIVLASPIYSYWNVWYKVEWIKFVCRMLLFFRRIRRGQRKKHAMTSRNMYVGRRTGVTIPMNGCGNDKNNNSHFATSTSPHLHDKDGAATSSVVDPTTSSPCNSHATNHDMSHHHNKMHRLVRRFRSEHANMLSFSNISYTGVAAEVLFFVRPLLWTSMQRRQHRVVAKSSGSSRELLPVLVPPRLLPRLKPWMITLGVELLSLMLAHLEQQKKNQRKGKPQNLTNHAGTTNVTNNGNENHAEDDFLPVDASSPSRVRPFFSTMSSSSSKEEVKLRQRKRMLCLYLLRTPVYDWFTSPVMQYVARLVSKCIPLVGHRMSSFVLFWLDYYQSNHYMMEHAAFDVGGGVEGDDDGLS